MTLFFVLLLILIFCFGFVLLFGAPYLPTLTKQLEAAIKLAELDESQTMIELGCGDGRVILAFAKKGVRVVGYELNPILYMICKLRLWRYGDKAQVIYGNFWNKDWPQADVVFTFLLDRYMSRLDDRLNSYEHKPVKLISYAFKIPNKKPKKSKNGVFMYIYK